MPILDTRQGKDLMGTFVADLVLQVLSFGAQNERENIRKRQRQGIEAAKLRGVHLGRPVKEMPVNFEELAKAYEENRMSLGEVLDQCHFSRSTYYRRRRETKSIH